MAEKFCWVENNAWWKGATRRMAAGEANDRNGDEWDEANRRLWCLAFEATRASPLKIQDLEDLVQTVLLRLQGLSLVHRLKEVDTPAHYLAAVMRNLLGNELRHARGARRNVRRHAKLIEAPQDQRPDRLAEWKELCDKARFVVNHALRADDRKVLWWFYRDGLSAAEIAQNLGISEAAALQRLARARKRLREEFQK